MRFSRMYLRFRDQELSPETQMECPFCDIPPYSLSLPEMSSDFQEQERQSSPAPEDNSCADIMNYCPQSPVGEIITRLNWELDMLQRYFLVRRARWLITASIVAQSQADMLPLDDNWSLRQVSPYGQASFPQSAALYQRRIWSTEEPLSALEHQISINLETAIANNQISPLRRPQPLSGSFLMFMARSSGSHTSN